jgi:threonine synthase
MSTRDTLKKVGIDEALSQGLADDGGLFIPSKLPLISLDEWDDKKPFLDFAIQLLSLFLADSKLQAQIKNICQKAFSFPIPLEKIDEQTYFLSLYNGPTLSFKDVGARFLAECLLALNKKMTIVVATSGDTGSAVASAFSGKPNIDVVVLFPKDKISKRQEAQMTCWEDNVKSIAVKGNFDDCQALVKAMFKDKSINDRLSLSTANSINIGRLLPQMTYYAYWALSFYRQHRVKPGVVIPSGNLGHMTACFWAKKMGFPLGELVIATNANPTLSHYIETGDYTPNKAIPTLANAMDVGAPSNFERLKYDLPTAESFKKAFKVAMVSDDNIKESIRFYYKKHNRLICPHTATAGFVRESLSKHSPYFIVETAHPSKFESVIEPLLGITIPVPKALSELLARQKEPVCIESSIDSLKTKL